MMGSVFETTGYEVIGLLYFRRKTKSSSPFSNMINRKRGGVYENQDRQKYKKNREDFKLL